MKLNELKRPPGAHRNPKRIGRGTGSGHGKTATRGHKGQRARAGGARRRASFQGGQMPLQRRFPKRGFRPPLVRGPHTSVINLVRLREWPAGEVVNVANLVAKGLIKKSAAGVKVLGAGDISQKLHFQVQAMSTQAQAKIEKLGGTVEILSRIL